MELTTCTDKELRSHSKTGELYSQILNLAFSSRPLHMERDQSHQATLAVGLVLGTARLRSVG